MNEMTGPGVALMPMRHHSERVPGKNYRQLGWVPLYHHVLRRLVACAAVSRVVIDTDSDVIWADVQRNFPQVVLLRRPEHLRGDHVPMTEVLAHDASQVPAPWYLQTHSTNPFLSGASIQQAVERWQSGWPGHDSLFSVTRLQARLWDHRSEPLNHDPLRLLPTQTLAPVYLENSCLYLFPESLIRTAHRRIGECPYLFELDPWEAVDIDEERDFAFAQRMIRAEDGPARVVADDRQSVGIQ